MFSLLMPVADYLLVILDKLGLPEVTYREAKDETSNLDLCTASVYFLKNGTQLRFFSASSPDGPSSARHLAAVAVVHHLKLAYRFVIVDMNHRELAELKGISCDPSPLHITHVSPMLEDALDPEAFVDFCIAEKNPLCLSNASSLPPSIDSCGKSPTITCTVKDSSVAPVVRGSVELPDTELPAAKKLKIKPKADTVKKTTATSKPPEPKCLDELKGMKKRIDQLGRENAKLQAAVLDYKLNAIHFQQSKARFMRVTRGYCDFFRRTEAEDNLYNANMPAETDGPDDANGP